MSDVQDTVIATVTEVLDLPPGTVGPTAGAPSVEAWDSFGHVRIVLALEAQFGIQLTLGEIEAATSIPGLVKVVEAARARAV